MLLTITNKLWWFIHNKHILNSVSLYNVIRRLSLKYIFLSFGTNFIYTVSRYLIYYKACSICPSIIPYIVVPAIVIFTSFIFVGFVTGFINRSSIYTSFIMKTITSLIFIVIAIKVFNYTMPCLDDLNFITFAYILWGNIFSASFIDALDLSLLIAHKGKTEL